MQQAQVNEGLERRLEEIKNNIKNQRNETASFGLRGSGAISNTRQSASIENLEDQLKKQKQRLDDL